ncbi:MAG: putative lipid II flippase FtsW [Rhodospirillaceae bacterium TMED63]|nr:putative lipid II flippase FtsW [Rhodospirillaceae bacterium]RPG02020.1 MAG: putative lipid II flippase FtsW [Rhodospirillaceae bacterium TMED63]
MNVFDRSDTSVLGRWWWTVDRWTLAAVGALIAFGIIMALAASPAVAERIGLDYFYFARRQLVYLPVALALMIGASLLSPTGVFRAAMVTLTIFSLLVVATFVIGTEIKGARRWIGLGPISVQPSEFLKPAFAVAAAWLFASARSGDIKHGNLISIATFGTIVGLLLLQPDVGMSVVISVVWSAQFFLAGLPLYWAVLLIVGGAGALVAAYFTLHHVASRIDRFLDPSSGDSFQVDRSLEAFINGGLFGRGPGEGTVKEVLPDAHSDFVFAVAGEEFGLFVCLIIVGLFAFIVLRGFARALQETDLFILLATAGLLVQFGLQAVINMGSTLRLMPTKGMTLPFVSYGGSSLIAMGLCIGFLLALTRKRVGAESQR